MRDFDLRSLQLCELDVLQEFIRVCEKNHLQYYLAWGTLLGAVRHQGFIPWDDDIDVCMPWEDYLKLKEACHADLSEAYFYEDWSTHNDYFLHWAKLRKNNTTCMTRSEADLKIHWGVGIDIFPLFPMDDNTVPFSKKMAHTVLELTLQRSYYKYGSEGLKKNMKKIIYSLLPKRCDSAIINYCFKVLTKSSDKASYWYDFSELSYRSLLPREVFGEGMDYCFEGTKMTGPKDADAYLRKAYGDDYMEIPQVEKQIDHGDLIVDLENDYTTYQNHA